MSTTLLDRLTIYHLVNEFQDFADTSLKILAVIGAVYLTKITVFSIWELMKILRQYGVTSLFYAKDFPRKYGGKWAVVTGASEGLGRAYAFELARRNMNVLLISRSIEKLEATSREIQKLYDIETKCLPFNLCLLKEESHYKSLEQELAKFDISILINNVGFLTETLQPFLESEKSELLSMHNLNMTVPSLMVHMLLPRFLEKKNGAIVNVSSIVSIHPTPYMGMYSATKIYVDYLTECLAYEYRDSGVTFQHLNPGYIKTRLTNFANFFGIVANPIPCADWSLRNLGVSLVTSGHIVHHIARLLAGSMPSRLWVNLMGIHNILWSLLTGKAVKYQKRK